MIPLCMSTGPEVEEASLLVQIIKQIKGNLGEEGEKSVPTLTICA